MNRLARALRRAGVGVGDAVGAALHNGFEWYELLNAVGKLGAQLVPIGYRLKGPEIAYMLADSGAKVLIAAPDLADEIDRALAEHRLARRRAVGGRRRRRRGAAAPYEEVLAGEPADEPAGAFAGGGFNTMIYTSGTTGRPKGIERDHRSGHARICRCSASPRCGGSRPTTCTWSPARSITPVRRATGRCTC